VRSRQLRYYGSADGTSWFLVVLAALGDPALEDELSHHWRAASAWVKRALERGDGLVRHGPRECRGGLAQQGWRDTSDPRQAYGGGIVDADGGIPEPPLADADTQAVTVAALRATARLTGDTGWSSLAEQTTDQIARAFTPDTMAVDRSDRRVSGAGSQLGWLLWADALPTGQREAYAERLSQPDVLTDFGLRTLSSEHPQFDAAAYHRGAVWPFDSWLGWGGLPAARRSEEAERVRQGVLRARAAGKLAGALRRDPRWSRVGPDRQPRAGVDDRCAVRARAGLGWTHQPLTAPVASPARIRFWKITTRMIKGKVMVTRAALIVPMGTAAPLSHGMNRLRSTPGRFRVASVDVARVGTPRSIDKGT
jgi:hypothetical protein